MYLPTWKEVCDMVELFEQFGMAEVGVVHGLPVNDTVMSVVECAAAVTAHHAATAAVVVAVAVVVAEAKRRPPTSFLV
jgi:hypothetical protein